ncbi:MAG: penicillin-insensitive murein endopeptidase, partial [Pseudomonadota bacterium]
FLREFADETQRIGWPGILIGDISQPRGGPMLSGHRSHQNGLDADIRYMPKPQRALTAYERATISGYKVADSRATRVNENFSPWHTKVLRLAARDKRVQRILTHASIKKHLCDTVTGDRTWLRKIRPVFGHNYHFHVRLFCPEGVKGCRAQKRVPRNDGCGPSLDYMLKRVAGKIRPPKRPEPKPGAKPWIHSIDKLPTACLNVLKVDRPQLLARSVAPKQARAPRPRRNPVR